MKSLVCLMGATATGKTDLAIDLCKRLPCEVVSVDSSLIYRGMDIGTAKPELSLRQQFPHHLIDIVDVTESYSVAKFYEDCEHVLADIWQRQRIPLLVGGTMLYFKALQGGLSEMPATDLNLREAINRQADEQGWPALHEQLKEIDPAAAKQIHPHDKQRIGRALEVFQATGKNLSSYWQTGQLPLPFKFINIALQLPREQLHERLAKRLSIMWQQGFVDEVADFYERADCHPMPSALRAVGYRQVWQYLQGEDDKETMQNKALYATRQFAKRQLTWLRRWPDLHEFEAGSEQTLSRVEKTLSTRLE